MRRNAAYIPPMRRCFRSPRFRSRGRGVGALLLVAAAATGCDQAFQEFVIRSRISEDANENLPNLADDLGTDLVLVFAQADADVLQLEGRSFDFVMQSAASPLFAQVDVVTGIEIDDFSGGPAHCSIEDLMVQEKDTGRSFVLAEAGACTESGSFVNIDANATFER